VPGEAPTRTRAASSYNKLDPAPRARRQDPPRLDVLPRQLGERDRDAAPLALGARVGEQRGDRRLQAVGLAHGSGKFLIDNGAVARALGLLQSQAQRGQRCAELVRHVGRELALAPDHPSDPLRAAPERVGDRVDLGHAGVRDADAEVALAQARRARGHALQRARQPARLTGGQREGQRHADRAEPGDQQR
jgi:hypothetical protein